MAAPRSLLFLPLLALACSESTTGDDRLFVPEDLPNTPQEGEVGVTLKLTACTLEQGATGPAIYAAVKNDGDTPSCSPGIVFDFIDKTGETVATAGTAVRTKQIYRFEGTVIGCIDPGQLGMVALTNLPTAVVVEELGSLKHKFPTFGLDGIVPVDQGFPVGQVETFAKDGGTAYRGKLTNGMDVTVTEPSVTIFPVNRVGRPLGAATSKATIELPAGESWSFETNSVNDLGVGYVAYPAASIAP